MQRHTKHLMMGTVAGVASLGEAFDWDLERIGYDSIRRHFDEIDNVQCLRKDTIYCVTCGKRLIIDYMHEGITYCQCVNPRVCTKNIPTNTGEEKPWKPYIESKNMVVWRREERPGLHAYKGIYLFIDLTCLISMLFN